jgi:hypothetical protein
VESFCPKHACFWHYHQFRDCGWDFCNAAHNSSHLAGNLKTVVPNLRTAAADLDFPATDPANAAGRAEFRLNTFPPDNHVPPTPPQRTPTAK